MLTGAHSIIYSTSPEGDRAFLRSVLGLPSVDVGDGWLIFGLPPSEVAVHPSDENNVHEFYFMCDDVSAFVAGMRARNITCAPVQDRGWGLLTQVVLPGGGMLGVYQPRHARPKPMAAAAKKARKSAGAKARKVKAKTARKPAKRRARRRKAR